VSRAELVRVFPRLYTGSHIRHPQYEHHRVRRVSVAAPGVVAYADGERLGALPVTAESVPAALTVLVGEGA
jgi:diacylglycerol kinase (ATP)